MTVIPRDTDGANRLHVEKITVESAMREAVNEAVLHHKRLGLPMVVWQDGEVVWIPADQLTVDQSGPAP